MLCDAFSLSAAAGDATNLVAWGNGSDGIHLTAGTFLLVHATAAANGVGIRRENAWTGTVINSISWSNTTSFVNFPAAQVLASDGFVAGTGNLNVDPQFVAPPTGNLHLQRGSPCLGVADVGFGLTTLAGHDENSRPTDHLLSGACTPDMGAFELQVWKMSVDGTPRPGSTITIELSGATTGFQTLTFPRATAAVGSLTRLYRALVRP